MARFTVVRAGKAVSSFSRFHETKEEALEEAKRLSIKESDSFLVLQVIGTVGPVRPEVEFVLEE